MKKPMIYGYPEGLKYCHPDCSYFEPESGKYACATCKRSGKDIDFYDGFIAHCKESGNMDG